MIEDKKIVEYVRTAASEVFSTMLGLEIENEPEYTDSKAPTVSDGVLAFVGIAGVSTGAGVISCSTAFACQICNHLLMMEATSVNDEVLDAVGEVANMIVGNFKTMVEEELGPPLGLSIPTVIYGHNFFSRSLGSNTWVVVPFSCKGEKLEIRCCLNAAPEPHPVRAGYTHASTVMA
jgi:chemotaxis protein CheX